jgi:pyruvate/2-oxoglutarate dehydrogenase complex dihydrolipoamide acyltransferase (E2) component
VRLVAPAPPHGWRIALGVGGVRATHGGDATHEMTLAMTYDTTTMDHTSAARLLERIASLLEEPLHLLAI